MFNHNKIKGLLFFLALHLFVSAFTQNSDKITIGILPFTYTGNSSNYAYSIQETVENAFIKAKRFNMVERSRLKELQAEKDLQKHEDFIDSKVLVSQGKSLGARYMIGGNVIAATYEEVYSTTNGNRKLDGYRGKINLLLKIIDVESGQIVSSETINVSGSGGFFSSFSYSQKPEAAIIESIKGMDKELNKYIAKNFPVTFRIVEIQEKKSDESAKTVLLAGGSGYGLSKGDKLKVLEMKEITVDGKIFNRKVEVGELKISKVEDENFSICSVLSGGDVIAQKLATNNLIVVTIK